MRLEGQDLSILVPDALDYEAMASKAVSLLSHRSKDPFAGTDEVMNCATATSLILQAGGLGIERRASLPTYHPYYSPLYRYGIRATQLGPNGQWGTQLEFVPIARELHGLTPRTTLYLYQQIKLTPDEPMGGGAAAPDLGPGIDLIEHVLPIWWAQDAVWTFDVRSAGNRILLLESYLEEERNSPAVASFLANVAGVL